MSKRIWKNERGFTLIELLTVMVIIGVLAAVMVPAMSGTGQKGRDAQAKNDGGTVETAAGEYFADQTGAEVLTPEVVTLLPSINAEAITASIEQVTSSRWPELSITDGAAAAAYFAEFATVELSPDSEVIDVTVIDSAGVNIDGETLLTGYTAVDFDVLAGGGYVAEKPGSVDDTSEGFHNYLWLFKKETTASGSGDDDSRSVKIIRLNAVVKTSSGTQLLYEQIQ